MMKTREIILRTSGAIVLALTVVLIPLSQAGAQPTVPCSIEPGTTTSFCGSRFHRCEITETVDKYWYITRFRPTQAPYCYETLECGGGGCKSAKPKKRRR
jgi:hypothetical protein